MPNVINKFKKYIDLIDEVYKNASTSADLDGDSTLVRAGANANEIVIPKLAMDGLGDYSRNNGYVNGNVNLTFETVSFNYDRGRSFQVDEMDDEETQGVAFGKLSAEFIRTKVVPEVDAFRYATYAAKAGASAQATLSTGQAVLDALTAAVTSMDESEVTNNLHLKITPTLYNLVQAVDTYKSKAIWDRFAKVDLVPQTRFYTAIDLLDGTTSGEEAGGYAKASGASNINFMIIEPSSVIQYPKHKVNKIIAPEDNQDADAYKFNYREYGIADTYANKLAGIYVHTV